MMLVLIVGCAAALTPRIKGVIASSCSMKLAACASITEWPSGGEFDGQESNSRLRRQSYAGPLHLNVNTCR